MRRSLACLLALAPLVTGCASERGSDLDIDRLSEAHQRYLADLAEVQEAFREANPMPVSRDFGPEGELYVHTAELIGTPGKEQLFVRFSYLNRTGLTIERARVVLTLTDDESGDARREFQDLRMPYGLAIPHGSSYTGFFDMPLEGLHRRSRWSWDLDLEAERQAPPGERLPAEGPGAARLGGAGRG
jgi:hypothetical protein